MKCQIICSDTVIWCRLAQTKGIKGPKVAKKDQNFEMYSVFFLMFLVAFTQLSWLVGWSVGWSVTLYFFYDFTFETPLLLPKWSSDREKIFMK